ncbi:MAG: diguanylate cyclase [Desulfobulbaceae bacterium]|nr:diguanylate cyclase [Desulfobulbaceae bacterium]
MLKLMQESNNIIDSDIFNLSSVSLKAMDVRPTYEELLSENTSLQEQIENLKIKNRKLAEQSNTDGLTTLYNHRFMMERCKFEFERAKRYGFPLSCIILDIDHFKMVNDTYGHQFGDFILRQLGALLKEKTRSADICGRYGGEEFIAFVALPITEATDYVFRLHKTIADHTFTENKNSTRITVSIGVAEYRSEMQSWRELIERADKVLYEAKKSGRNLVRIWSDKNDTYDVVDNNNIDSLKNQFLYLYTAAKAGYIESTNALLKAIDAKDHYTLRHSQNVATFAVMLAKALNMKEHEIQLIKNAALLHDIGKIGIDGKFLTKKESLTSDEYEILKRHPQIGVNIIKDISLLSREMPIILHHHERYNGSGYPHGLRRSEIPIGAKILAISDAFDAMTTDREFKQKLTTHESLQEIISQKGRQFDPHFVDVFVTCVENLKEDEIELVSTDISPTESLSGVDDR